jgi:hypothetical protein
MGRRSEDFAIFLGLLFLLRLLLLLLFGVKSQEDRVAMQTATN